MQMNNHKIFFEISIIGSGTDNVASVTESLKLLTPFYLVLFMCKVSLDFDQ